MRSRADGRTPAPPTPESAFSSTFLDRLRDRDEPLTAPEAEYAGPWRTERLPGRPGAIAVLRAWESVERGDRAEAVFEHEETALRLAALLPALEREPLFHLAEVAGPEGFAVEAVHGERGARAVGWLRRYEPRVVEALHLLEAIARSPAALATLLEAAGPVALEQVGRILARRAEE